jgi:hypothetical protein
VQIRTPIETADGEDDIELRIQKAEVPEIAHMELTPMLLISEPRRVPCLLNQLGRHIYAMNEEAKLLCDRDGKAAVAASGVEQRRLDG